MQGDFKEFFDLKFFDDRRLGEMEFVLNSPAYEHTFKPYITGILRGLEAYWKDRSQDRKDKYPDDFLAGGVAMSEGLLQFFEQVVKETRMERVHAAMEGITNDELYARKQARGEVKPVVGLDQSASPTKLVDDDEF